jgi:hypothetical protein
MQEVYRHPWRRTLYLAIHQGDRRKRTKAYCACSGSSWSGGYHVNLLALLDHGHVAEQLEHLSRPDNK